MVLKTVKFFYILDTFFIFFDICLHSRSLKSEYYFHVYILKSVRLLSHLLYPRRVMSLLCKVTSALARTY